MRLSEVIKKYREDNNLTCRDMAKMSGISPTLVSMIEREESFPKVDVIEKLAKAMHIPLEKLLKHAYTDTSKKGIYKAYLTEKELKERNICEKTYQSINKK